MGDITEFIKDKYLDIKEVKDSFEKLKKEITTQIELINSITNAKSLEIFLKLRFSRDFNFNGKKENISEFLNQASTSLVTLKALYYLIETHGEYSFKVNWSVSSGPDIIGVNTNGNEMIAEVFSAVTRNNNGKLKKDKDKLSKKGNEKKVKYLFFYSHINEKYSIEIHNEVTVVQFSDLFKLNE